MALEHVSCVCVTNSSFVFNFNINPRHRTIGRTHALWTDAFLLRQVFHPCQTKAAAPLPCWLFKRYPFSVSLYRRRITFFGATSKSASNDHRAARIQELVTVSPYFGSPVGAVRSPAHPQRGLEADLVLDGSRTIFRAATGTAISEMRCYAWKNGLRHPVCIVRNCHHLARHVQGIF